jgi:hypothetical protein
LDFFISTANLQSTNVYFLSIEPLAPIFTSWGFGQCMTIGYRGFFRHFKTGWPSTDMYQYFTLIFLSIWSFPKIVIYSKTLSVIGRPAFPSVGLCKNMSKQTKSLSNVYNCWCISLGQPLIFGMSMGFFEKSGIGYW